MAGLALPCRLQPARRARPLPDRLRAGRRRAGRSSTVSRSTRSTSRTRSPTRNWSWRAALDIGEYNLGQLAERRGEERRRARERRLPRRGRAARLRERGRVLVRHDARGRDVRARRRGRSGTGPTRPRSREDARFARELVLVAAYPNGNYTYTNEYVFRMDGGIDVRAGSTGTTLNRGVRNVAEGDQFGTSVAPNIAAPMPPALLQLPDRLRRRRAEQPARRGEHAQRPERDRERVRRRRDRASRRRASAT